jgi:hypothetical protein
MGKLNDNEEVLKHNEVVAKDNALFAELDALKYHELKAKFESMGLDGVFKAGKKKGELIKLAMQAYEAVQLGGDVEKASEKVVEKKAKVAEIGGLTREQLEKNLENIKLLISGGVESHKAVLRAKREKLEAELKDLK